MKRIIYLCFALCFFISCSQEDELISVNEISDSENILKSAANSNFDWENVYETEMKNEYGQVTTKSLPWRIGIPNSGVPILWLDQYLGEAYEKRMYTRLNGWELVYSNLMEATAYKFIGLYNRYTGMLRFFLTIYANPAGPGTSQSIWGISANCNTSLFDFTKSVSDGINSNRSENPSIMVTPKGSFANNQFQSVGLGNGIWYAFEVECAYDPQLKDKNYLFTLMGRAINNIKYTGNIQTNGNIEGTIKGVANNSGMNFNFSDMFNKSSTDKSIQVGVTGNGSVVKVLGDKIEDGISKNDSFFKSLWKNIKKNVSSGVGDGVKAGLSSIISKGGSLVGDALGGLVSSVIGTNKENISKVELNVKLESQVNLEGEQQMIGWSDIRIPIAGSSNIPSNRPIYNEPLGVWNLSGTPIVYYDAWEHDWRSCGPWGNCNSVYANYFNTFEYSYNVGIVLNPDLEKDFRISGVQYHLLVHEKLIKDHMFYYSNRAIGHAIVDGENYYDFTYYDKTREYKTKWLSGTKDQAKQNSIFYKFKLLVKFDLVNKNDASQKFHYSRIFNTTNQLRNFYTRDLVIGSWPTGYWDECYRSEPYGLGGVVIEELPPLP